MFPRNIPVLAWSGMRPAIELSEGLRTQVRPHLDTCAPTVVREIRQVPEILRGVVRSHCPPEELQVPYLWMEPASEVPPFRSSTLAAWVRRYGIRPLAYLHGEGEAYDVGLIPSLAPSGAWYRAIVTLPRGSEPGWSWSLAAFGLSRAAMLAQVVEDAPTPAASDLRHPRCLGTDPSSASRSRVDQEGQLRRDPHPGNRRILTRAREDGATARWLALPPAVTNPQRVPLTHHDAGRFSYAALRYCVDPLAKAVCTIRNGLSSHDAVGRERVDKIVKMFGWAITTNQGRWEALSLLNGWRSLPYIDRFPRVIGEFLRHYGWTDCSDILRRVSAMDDACDDATNLHSMRGRHCTIDLWQRDPVRDAALELDPTVFADLGVQVLMARAPNGMPMAALALRLMYHHLTGTTHILAHRVQSRWYPYRWWLESLKDVAQKIADVCGVPLIADADTTFSTEALTYPLYPASIAGEIAAPDPAQVHRHPYEHLKAQFFGAYEALQPQSDGRVIVLPGVEGPLGAALGDEVGTVLRHLVDPDPLRAETAPPAEYRWAFSGDRGRAVAHWLGNPGVTVAGATWHHAVSIGVGITSMGRYYKAPEYWDGYTDSLRALRRLYFSWFLHFAAGEFGVRAPLVAAIWNRGVPRDPAHRADAPLGRHDTATVVMELRRETLRLGDLHGKSAEVVEATLSRAKQRLCQELGCAAMTDVDFVSWCATMLGRQLAILSAFEVDHGIWGGCSQLHSDNVSLAIECGDYETARFHPEATARHRSRREWDSGEPVSLLQVTSLEQAARRTAKKETWVSQFVRLAPTVRLGTQVRAAYRASLAELRHKHVDPRAARREFRHTTWAPFYRAHARDLQWQHPTLHMLGEPAA